MNLKALFRKTMLFFNWLVEKCSPNRHYSQNICFDETQSLWQENTALSILVCNCSVSRNRAELGVSQMAVLVLSVGKKSARNRNGIQMWEKERYIWVSRSSLWWISITPLHILKLRKQVFISYRNSGQTLKF